MATKKEKKKKSQKSSSVKKDTSKKIKKQTKKKVVTKEATTVSKKEPAKIQQAETQKKQEQKTILLFCPRCKRETDNTITSFIGQKIRRVRCEVCKSEYNYHRIQALKKRMEEDSSIKSSEAKEIESQQNCYRIWEDLMLGRDASTAQPYNIEDKYFENDLINHPVFGIGVVRTVMEDYKIEVVFKNCIKILAHNRFLNKK
jgi:formate dehydrogenase maturation protein FdhE